MRFVFNAAAVLALTACQPAPAPKVEEPAKQEVAMPEPIREEAGYATADKATETATGFLNLVEITQPPMTDVATGQPQGAASTSTEFNFGNELTLKADLVGGADLTMLVKGKPLSSYLPKDATSAQLHRITQEGGPEGAVKLCGAKPAVAIVDASGEAATSESLGPPYVMLVFSGDEPGKSGAELCQVLRYVFAAG
jgi:hypothetical protein